MSFILHQLAFETTRRCNIRCKHCMRGESQNINLTKEIVDQFLDNNEISTIESICFSGGEPTLNPEIIIYTINKIIEENLDVQELVMVTNGQIFNKELVEAFKRFNIYCNHRAKRSIIEKYEDILEPKSVENMIKTNTDNHVRITFSTDEYHKSINEDVKKAYFQAATGLRITESSVPEDEVYKTGFADFGKDFEYKLVAPRYYKEKRGYWIMDVIYVTATGFLTTEGMGQYTDMDKINMGHISETNIRNILIKYGEPVFDTKPISEEKSTLLVKK